MMKRNIVVGVCMVMIFSFMLYVFMFPGFGEWDNKSVAEHYIQNSLKETNSANVVGSIVWDFRSFDTLGEETVLFTAAMGIFSLVMFGLGKGEGK